MMVLGGILIIVGAVLCAIYSGTKKLFIPILIFSIIGIIFLISGIVLLNLGLTEPLIVLSYILIILGISLLLIVAILISMYIV